MQRGRMGGRFFVVPFEVHDKLQELRASCRQIYYSLLRHGFIEENWNTEGEWVTGLIRLSKNELMRLAGRKKGGRFYTETWPDLIASGLVSDEEDGTIKLLMVKKKSDAAISPGEIREMQTRINSLANISPGEITEMQTRINNLEHVISQNDKIINGAVRSPKRPHMRPHEASNGTFLGGGHPYMDPRRIDQEEEEETAGSGSNGQRKVAAPGSRMWIISRLDKLWPGRGYKKDIDEVYLEQLEKYSAEILDEAFTAAKKARIKRGNFDWILNRLENPELYVKTGKRKGAARREKQESETNVGTLHADWLDTEEEV